LEAILIELRRGFCDPDGELLGVLDRPGWRRVTNRRKGEVVDELVRVCEQRGLWEADAWLRPVGAPPRHVIGYWHPPSAARVDPAAE
jgi:hypothetical protein